MSNEVTCEDKVKRAEVLGGLMTLLKSREGVNLGWTTGYRRLYALDRQSLTLFTYDLDSGISLKDGFNIGFPQEAIVIIMRLAANRLCVNNEVVDTAEKFANSLFRGGKERASIIQDAYQYAEEFLVMRMLY